MLRSGTGTLTDNDQPTGSVAVSPASVLEDAAKKKELFGVIDKAWFSGADDPDLELVAVKINEAEYWNVKENKLLQLLKMATAAATGERPKMGEHKELDFH